MRVKVSYEKLMLKILVHPLERQLLDLQNDFSIDAAIQRVALSTIIYGKTVSSKFEIFMKNIIYKIERFLIFIKG